MFLKTVRHRALPAALLGAGAVLAAATPALAQRPAEAASLAAGAIAPAATVAHRVPSTFFGMQPPTAGTLTAAQLAGVTPASGVGAITLIGDGMNWRDIQPTAPVAGQPPAYNWTALDSAIANARSKGVTQINVVVAGTPCWAAALKRVAGEVAPCYASPPTAAGYTAWSTFIRDLALRYQSQITSVQIWAETDLTSRWRGTPAQLALMTTLARNQIKSVKPSLLVAAGSTTTRLHNLGTWYLPFLKALGARKWPVDAFVANFYPPANGTPVTRQQQIAEFKTYLAKAHAPSRQIWEGEINYGAPGIGLRHVVLDNATGAAYVARTYLDGLRFGISRVYWSAWAPRGAVYGVTMWPGYIGPRALRTTYGWLANHVWHGCTTAKPSTGTFVTCQVSSTTSASSFTARIVWSEGRTASYKVPAGVTRFCNVLGGCAATKPGRVVKIGASPMWFGR